MFTTKTGCNKASANWHILKFFHTGLIQVQISKPQNPVSVKTEKITGK